MTDPIDLDELEHSIDAIQSVTLNTAAHERYQIVTREGLLALIAELRAARKVVEDWKALLVAISTEAQFSYGHASTVADIKREVDRALAEYEEATK